jgi:hypothetical protein
MRHRRFTFVHLLDTYLPPFADDFTASLTTTPFERSSTRWFGTCPCRPIPGDLPPSSTQFGGIVSAFVTHHFWECFKRLGERLISQATSNG